MRVQHTQLEQGYHRGDSNQHSEDQHYVPSQPVNQKLHYNQQKLINYLTENIAYSINYMAIKYIAKSRIKSIKN